MTHQAMGSWLSDALHKTVRVIAGHGNDPGTPDTRKYGYDPAAVSDAVVKQLETAPPVTTASPGMQALVLAGAGLAVVYLFSKKPAAPAKAN